jgi:outer membrane protein assembly factor BamA
MEPPKILVGSVTISGAPALIEPQLTGFTDAVKGKPYNSAGYWYPKSRVTDVLQASGYLSATESLAAGPAEKVSASEYHVPLTLHIDSGPQYHIAALTVDGGPLFPNEDLAKRTAIGPGAIAMPSIAHHLEASIDAAYRHAGYPYVQFDDDPQLDVEHGLATYHIRVDPGPQYHIRSVSFANLDPALEPVAREILGIKPGDVYNSTALIMLLPKLRRDPRFNGLNFSYKPTEDAQNHLVDLSVAFFKQ